MQKAKETKTPLFPTMAKCQDGHSTGAALRFRGSATTDSTQWPHVGRTDGWKPATLGPAWPPPAVGQRGWEADAHSYLWRRAGGQCFPTKNCTETKA